MELSVWEEIVRRAAESGDWATVVKQFRSAAVGLRADGELDAAAVIDEIATTIAAGAEWTEST